MVQSNESTYTFFQLANVPIIQLVNLNRHKMSKIKKLKALQSIGIRPKMTVVSIGDQRRYLDRNINVCGSTYQHHGSYIKLVKQLCDENMRRNDML